MACIKAGRTSLALKPYSNADTICWVISPSYQVVLSKDFGFNGFMCGLKFEGELPSKASVLFNYYAIPLVIELGAVTTGACYLSHIIWNGF